MSIIYDFDLVKVINVTSEPLVFSGKAVFTTKPYELAEFLSKYNAMSYSVIYDTNNVKEVSEMLQTELKGLNIQLFKLDEGNVVSTNHQELERELLAIIQKDLDLLSGLKALSGLGSASDIRLKAAMEAYHS